MLGELKMSKLNEIEIILDTLGLENRKFEFGIEFYLDGFDFYVEYRKDHYLLTFGYTGLELSFDDIDDFSLIIKRYSNLIRLYNSAKDIKFNETLEDITNKESLETLLKHIKRCMAKSKTLEELNRYYSTNKLCYKNKELLKLNEIEYKNNFKRIVINNIENDIFGVE